MSAQPELRYTLEEYLELDQNSDERLEFWDGEVFSMSGVSDQHSQIEVNLIASLDRQLSPRGCRVFPANMLIKVPSLPPYRYGDVSAPCGEPQFEVVEGVDVLVTPRVRFAGRGHQTRFLPLRTVAERDLPQHQIRRRQK